MISLRLLQFAARQTDRTSNRFRSVGQPTPIVAPNTIAAWRLTSILLGPTGKLVIHPDNCVNRMAIMCDA